MSSLLSSQGPLANVWLASNYDKKLSKLQFLNTDIISSSHIVSGSHITASTAGSSGNTITLRLSGQLLLGIVRIYLRKTKYLLDDVHETLYKLKNSFKYASGASLGPTTASTVNLPPQRTTLINPVRIQLQDQVTDLDLFYQPDLVLDDEPSSAAEVLGASEFDRLIEVGRNIPEGDDLDLDLDLDFDLDADTTADQSIEQGRDAQVAMPDADQSLFDLESSKHETTQMNINLSDPLEPRPVAADEEQEEPITPGRDNANIPSPIEAPVSPARRARANVSNGVIRTTKRKLIIDSTSDLERGIPNSILQEIQHLQTHRRFSKDVLTVQLTLQEKLDLIEELAEPLGSKRRKVGNLDEQLRRRCLELSLEEATEEPMDATLDPDTSAMGTNLDFDTDIKFDLSLPELESDNVSSPDITTEQPDAVVLEDLTEDSTTIENPRATAQVAGHLRDIFGEIPRVSFDALIEKDTHSSKSVPLGATSVSDSNIMVNGRREATKCFFELLVLASQDCITIEQSLPDSKVNIPSNPYIRPRDNLVTKFL